MAALLGILMIGLVLSGCSVSTPLCDRATTLLTQGRPIDAMALYARAEDEGNCAGNGLGAAGEQIGRAAEQEAAGATAEQAGDATGAVAAYQAALNLNAGDARAAAGLVRLGQQVGTPAPAEIPAIPQPVAQPPWWRADWPLLAGGLLLLVALAATAYGLFRTDVLRRKLVAVEATATTPLAQPVPDSSAAVADLRARTDAAADVLAERCTGLEAAMARLESGAAHRDRLLELLAGQLAGQPRTGGQREQLFAAAERPDEPQGEGSAVVDVQLADVVTTDGRHRRVAQRVRWTPPEDTAADALAEQLGADPVTIVDVLATGTVTPAWARSTELWLLPDDGQLAEPNSAAGTGTGSPGPLATLVSGGAVRPGRLTRLTADTARQFAADGSPRFLARLITIVIGGAWQHASLTSVADDTAAELAALLLEGAAGLTGPVWSGSADHTAGPPAELQRLLGSPDPAADPDPDRPAAPVAVEVTAEPVGGIDPAAADAPGPQVRTAYRIERFAVDVDAVLRLLNRGAADAARPLTENPTDAEAIEAFRGALRHDRAVTVACDVVAIGDDRHRLDFRYRVGTARLDLARMLTDSAELTIAFGVQLAATRSGQGRPAFDSALRDAVTPEQLGAVAATLPGRSPALTVGPGSAGSVDTRYTPAGESPTVRIDTGSGAGPVRNGSQMYDTLARRRARPGTTPAQDEPAAPQPEVDPEARTDQHVLPPQPAPHPRG